MSVISYGAFRWFFTIKNHLRADDYATTVCAIKSTQLKQGRTTRCVFFNTRTCPSLFRKRFNFFVIRKATFRTQKRFHNKQYTPNQKINLLNQRALILTYGLTTATCNVPSDLYFSSCSPNLINQPQNQSQKNHNKQPTQSLNQKHAQNKHNKQLRQNAMFLNIKISQKATTSKQTTNTLFIKTQYNNKKQSNILPLR